MNRFLVQREASRFRSATATARATAADTPALLHTRGQAHFAGLINFPYLQPTARVLVTTLALGGLIFLTLPRHAGATRLQSDSQIAHHPAVFDEEMALGQVGEILENETVVMTVKFTDMAGKTIHPPGEPLWRGVTMLRYESGRWRRQPRKPQMYVGFPGHNLSAKLIRQEIKLQAVDSPTLFAIRPIRYTDAGDRLPPFLYPVDGTLQRPDLRVGAYDYTVLSDPDPAGFQMGEQAPDLAYGEGLLAIPESLKARLRKIAEPLVADIREAGRKRTECRARALESFLRDSRKYRYSVRTDVVDPKLDPVEDFLVNRKEGHCEYFASALALMLRSIDIPTRMVNGFKGGDWNEITQTMNVRQKHAHSWVEAFVGLGPESQPIWITLDPTPREERKKP